MTYLRTTELSMSTRVMTNLQNSLSRVEETQTRLSGGKIITRPSDDPSGTAAAMQTRGALQNEQQYQRNSDDGMAWLNSIEGGLSNAGTMLSKVRDLALQGSSAGTGGSEAARKALATEVRQIRESLIGVANTSYLGRPVFGGTTSKSFAYDETGAYKGDEGEIRRTVADNTKLAVNVTGTQAFGSGDSDVFKILNDIADHLESSPSSLSADMTKLQSASDTVRNKLADVGARYNRIESMRGLSETRVVELTDRLSGYEDIDLPQTIMDLTLRQTSYQAALGAAAKVIQPSLVDFLK